MHGFLNDKYPRFHNFSMICIYYVKNGGGFMTKITRKILLILLILSFTISLAAAVSLTYPIVDTGQIRCYDNEKEIEYPAANEAFYRQDANYEGLQPSYRDNGDGTITDLNTGLMWQQDPGEKMTFAEAVDGADDFNLAGYTDWRLPTIKELYSLILFSGTDPDPQAEKSNSQTPFMDTDYFHFTYGDPANNERVIDSQFASSTKYVNTTMNGAELVFGVNFADGRIKGYGMGSPRGGGKKFFVLYVRGNEDYGKNDLKDNGNGTITDNATGLTWMQSDSGKGMTWEEALEWAENLEYAGYSDWRLPNAKELQSIVDYSRSPDTTDSPAIDPVFSTTSITNEKGEKDYPFYWSSTSHTKVTSAYQAAYVSFGRSMGNMTDMRTGQSQWMDVHGAGSQRSDPKAGNPDNFTDGRGPQGDAVHIYNYVRCVRGGTADKADDGPEVVMKKAIQVKEQVEQTPKMGMGNFSEMFIKRLDKDNDGKVSKSEFDGPANHFSHLDKDNDGYISQSEAPNGPPQGKR